MDLCIDLGSDGFNLGARRCERMRLHACGAIFVGGARRLVGCYIHYGGRGVRACPLAAAAAAPEVLARRQMSPRDRDERRETRRLGKLTWSAVECAKRARVATCALGRPMAHR